MTKEIQNQLRPNLGLALIVAELNVVQYTDTW